MNRRDLDASPIPSLGVRIGIWNGGREGTTAVGVTTSCGCFDEPGSAFALNSLLISLPNQGPDADRILTVPVLQRILDAAVRAFDPDWAVVVSRAHMKSWPTGSEGGPHAGWITYVSSRNMKAKLAADCRDLSSVNVAALGTAWISTEERFSSGNPVHVARARVVEEIVGRKA